MPTEVKKRREGMMKLQAVVEQRQDEDKVVSIYTSVLLFKDCLWKRNKELLLNRLQLKIHFKYVRKMLK